MLIDFSRIELFTDVAHMNCSICDVRTQFADIIYNYGHGVESRDLAYKIYNSKGLEPYEDEEMAQIEKYSRLCSPSFIDAIDRIIKSKSTK